MTKHLHRVGKYSERKFNGHRKPEEKPEKQVCICTNFTTDPTKLPNPPCAGCPRNIKK